MAARLTDGAWPSTKTALGASGGVRSDLAIEIALAVSLTVAEVLAVFTFSRSPK